MLAAYTEKNGQAVGTNSLQKSIPYFWIDLLNPSCEDINSVENHLNLNLPIKNIKERDISNRFFQEDNAYFLTILVSKDKNILFVLKDTTLITIRTTDVLLPSPSINITTAETLLSFFINKFIQEIADSLENQERLLLQISETVNNYAKEEIRNRTCSTSEQKKTAVVINNVLISVIKNRRRLTVLCLLADFISKYNIKIPEQSSEQIDTLIEQTGFLNDQVSFLQNTLIDFINISQYNIQSKVNLFSSMLSIPLFMISFFGMSFGNLPALAPLFRVNHGFFFVLALTLLGTYLLCSNMNKLQFA